MKVFYQPHSQGLDRFARLVRAAGAAVKVFHRPFTGPHRFARLVRAVGAAVKVFLRLFTGPRRFARLVRAAGAAVKVFLRPFAGPRRFARLVRAAGAAMKVFLRPFTGPCRFTRLVRAAGAAVKLFLRLLHKATIALYVWNRTGSRRSRAERRKPTGDVGGGYAGGTDGPCRRRPGMKTGANSESDEAAGLAARRPTGSGESSADPVSTGIRSVSCSSAD